MKKIISKAEFLDNKNKYLKLIKDGSIFVYPTDTIYGIGCNALISKSVLKIRKIKERYSKPFSVIAPDKNWIKNNCQFDNRVNDQLKKLPGKYTLILNLKNKKSISTTVNNGMSTIGVRIPYNWFYSYLKNLKIPIVTTSVNKSGRKYMTSIKDIDKDILRKVDFLVYAGKKLGRPSKIIDLT